MENLNLTYLTVILLDSHKRQKFIKWLEKDGFRKLSTNVYERMCKDEYSAQCHREYTEKKSIETITNIQIVESNSDKHFRYDRVVYIELYMKRNK